MTKNAITSPLQTSSRQPIYTNYGHLSRHPASFFVNSFKTLDLIVIGILNKPAASIHLEQSNQGIPQSSTAASRQPGLR